MTAKVVRLHPAQRRSSERGRSAKLTPVQQRTANSAVYADDEELFIKNLRGTIWADVGKTGRKWADLAADAKLSPQTIQNFASGSTRRPHLISIYRMGKAVGYELDWRPAGKNRKQK